MTLNDYQERAMETCMPSCENFSYMMLNLVGEVGEFASKVAKALRKRQIVIAQSLAKTWFIDNDYMPEEKYKKWRNDLKKEAGDILWQLSGLCEIMGWKLEDLAQQNLDKLASRKERGVIDGNGDNR